MLLFILLVPFLLAYFVTGLRVARAKYAIEKFEYDALGDNRQYNNEQYNMAVSKRNSLGHKTYCYLRYSSLKAEGCTCNNKESWNRYNEHARQAKQNLLENPMPQVSWNTVWTWPVVKMTDYITSGEVQKPNYALISKMELQELGIHDKSAGR